MPPTVPTYCKLVDFAQHWAFTMEGWLAQDPPCNNVDKLNDSWLVSWLSGCIWQSVVIPDTICIQNLRWFLQRGHPLYPSKWVVRLSGSPASGTRFAWSLAEADFRPTESNVLSLETAEYPEWNPPATVLITPAFPP